MRFIRFIKETTFVVTRKEKTVISMPTVVFALLMLFFWQFLIPVMIIALFFGVGYFFDGAQGTGEAQPVPGKSRRFCRRCKKRVHKR